MKLSDWQRWHRAAGFAVAVIVLPLCVTGFMLNHADALGLARRSVAAGWLLDWYDIAPPGPAAGFPVGDHWITRIGGRVYLDRREIANGAANLIGAVGSRGTIMAAVDERLMILADTGETIEILDVATGVPAGIRAIGVGAGGEIVIDAARGRYQADPDVSAWEATAIADAAWAAPAEPPADLIADLLRAYRGADLPLERVLLDLHSGRFLGPIGVWIVDAVGLLFIFLAASGIWIWLRRPREWAEDGDDGSEDE